MKDKINWERERQREISERTRSEKGKKKHFQRVLLLSSFV